jgi:hypothetical protein
METKSNIEMQGAMPVGSGDLLGIGLSGMANHLLQKFRKPSLAFGGVNLPKIRARHVLALIYLSLNLIKCEGAICLPRGLESAAPPTWNVLNNVQARLGNLRQGCSVSLVQLASDSVLDAFQCLNVQSDKLTETLPRIAVGSSVGDKHSEPTADYNARQSDYGITIHFTHNNLVGGLIGILIGMVLVTVYLRYLT